MRKHACALALLVGCLLGSTLPGAQASPSERFSARQLLAIPRVNRRTCGLRSHSAWKICCARAAATNTFQPLCPGAVNKCGKNTPTIAQIRKCALITNTEIGPALQDSSALQTLFANYAAANKKHYANANERAVRVVIFRENLKNIFQLNAAPKTYAYYGFNRFTDRLGLEVPTGVWPRVPAPTLVSGLSCGTLSPEYFMYCCARRAVASTYEPICPGSKCNTTDAAGPELQLCKKVVDAELTRALTNSTLLSYEFTNWCMAFDKHYANATERDYRQGIFESNLQRILQSNAEQPSALFAPGRFADFLPD